MSLNTIPNCRLRVFFTAFSATCSRGGRKTASQRLISSWCPVRRLRFPVLPLQAGFQSITGASTLIRLPDIKCRPQKELSHYSILNFHLIFSSSSSSCESLPRRKKRRKKKPPAGPTFTPCVNTIIYFWLRLLVGASCPAAGTRP